MSAVCGTLGGCCQCVVVPLRGDNSKQSGLNIRAMVDAMAGPLCKFDALGFAEASMQKFEAMIHPCCPREEHRALNIM